MLLLIFIQWFLAGTLYSQTHLPDTMVALWSRYKNAHDDSARVVCLSGLAYFYTDYMEDYEKADSLAEAAIRIAEMNHRPGLLLLAYNRYIETTDNSKYVAKALSYAKKALQNCRINSNPVMNWRTYINMAQVYLSRYNFSDANTCSLDAFRIANDLKNDTMIAESFICLGKSLDYNNEKTTVQGFTNFLTAREIAEKTGNLRLLQKCYAQLYEFYKYNKMHDEAIESKRKEGAIIQRFNPVDSAALIWIQYDLQLIDIRQEDCVINEQNVIFIIDFAVRNRNKRLKAWEFALYRTYLLKTEDVERLFRFYIKTFPEDFTNLKLTDIEMYYRLKGYFTEFERKPDSALYYFEKAEQSLISDKDHNNLYKSNFYNRYGQFLMRQGHAREAIEKFTRSYLLAEADNYPGRFDFMKNSSGNLELLFTECRDYKSALYYSVINRQISDSISKNSVKDQIMAETVRQERSQSEIAAEKDRAKIRQRENQRNMMAGGVVFFIILSLLVYRNYRNQKRLNRLLDQAKRQSDHLLLNILPAETAEELKKTGKAVAKRFDEVTVMFTDFRNFTQASELMSAEKLVHEINFYFSEFDRIILRHSIEKIKIIGDSYMCAGGLPVANQTHAHDVVKAAMEFQDFIMTQRSERITRNEPFFELRIGIHTGPVVAGIVGLKKFAYDIWGDTVNTASRMENTCEPGRINISGATYAKVKDRFQCTYRGKVVAKHKGEIDMYFVDSGIT